MPASSMSLSCPTIVCVAVTGKVGCEALFVPVRQIFVFSEREREREREIRHALEESPYCAPFAT